MASKLYSNEVFTSNVEMKKAKGVKKDIIKKQITRTDYEIFVENKITKDYRTKDVKEHKT